MYMHGDLCSVRNGSCVYAWRHVFSAGVCKKLYEGAASAAPN